MFRRYVQKIAPLMKSRALQKSKMLSLYRIFIISNNILKQTIEENEKRKFVLFLKHIYELKKTKEIFLTFINKSKNKIVTLIQKSYLRSREIIIEKTKTMQLIWKDLISELYNTWKKKSKKYILKAKKLLNITEETWNKIQGKYIKDTILKFKVNFKKWLCENSLTINNLQTERKKLKSSIDSKSVIYNGIELSPTRALLEINEGLDKCYRDRPSLAIIPPKKTIMDIIIKQLSRKASK